MKPPWFPKVAHAVHRVEVPVGQRDWMREAGRGRRGKGDWVLSYNYDAFSVAANSICFGHIKMLSVLPTIRVSPLHFTLSLFLPFSLPLFLAAFLFLLLTKRTNWIYLLRISNAHKVNFCQLPRICTVPYIYTINIRYIHIYGDRERDMFVCLPRGHCCIIWSGGWLKNNSIWFYLHCFDGFKRCTTLCQAAYGRGV